jgi:hypothetical protein
LHVCASVATLFAQLGGVHTTEVPGYVQRSGVTPLHVPAQFGSVPAHGARTPRGAPTTEVHVPKAPPTLHASHCPMQAESQQTPSTQYDDAHSVESLHASALGRFGRHRPATQNLPRPQSWSEVHWFPHRVSTHAPPQSIRCSGGHVPMPSQLATMVAVPPAQLAARHSTPCPGYTQESRLVPSQNPPHALPSVTHGVRAPRGEPLGTGLHLPSLPPTSQASHCPAHRASQHTPSAQILVVQSESCAHLLPPVRSGTHFPAEQKRPA